MGFFSNALNKINQTVKAAVNTANAVVNKKKNEEYIKKTDQQWQKIGVVNTPAKRMAAASQIKALPAAPSPIFKTTSVPLSTPTIVKQAYAAPNESVPNPVPTPDKPQLVLPTVNNVNGNLLTSFAGKLGRAIDLMPGGNSSKSLFGGPIDWSATLENIGGTGQINKYSLVNSQGNLAFPVDNGSNGVNMSLNSSQNNQGVDTNNNNNRVITPDQQKKLQTNPYADKARATADSGAVKVDYTQEEDQALVDQANQTIAEVIDMYNNDQISAEDAQRRMAEASRKATEARYNKIKEQALGLIPQYQDFETRSIRDLEGDLGDLNKEGDLKKTEITNTYGDLLRRSVMNKGNLDSQRRNMFSGLGTAESSAFLEEQGRADRDFLSAQTETERQMASQTGNIDTELLKAQRDTDNTIADLKKDTQLKIEAVLKDANATDQEKMAALDTIDANLQTNLASLVESFNNKKAALAQQQAGFAQNLAMIREQGNIQERLYDKMYGSSGLGGQAATLQNQAAANAEYEQLKGYIAKNGYDYRARLWQSELAKKYPGLSSAMGAELSAYNEATPYQYATA